MKQTAVEWLYEEFTKTNHLTEDEFYIKFQQAKEQEELQMVSFGKAAADYWGMMPVSMDNVKDLLNATKPIWGGNPGMNDDVKTTDKKISDLPLTMSMNEVFGGKGSCIVDAKSLGETTIEFPKRQEPEPNNPNRATLDEMTFRFTQEANCVDGTSDDVEEIIVEAKSSLGIDNDGGAFYVLRTEQWAFDDVNELATMLRRVEVAVNATNPTSVHTK